VATLRRSPWFDRKGTRPLGFVIGASPSNVKPSLRLNFPCQQRSCFSLFDERVLRHNNDIPSISLHFPNDSTRMIGGPVDICVYERMFWVGICLPFSPIIREMLSFLGEALEQLMPNGRRYFLAMFLLWPTIFPGETMLISELFNICGPHIYPNTEVVTFMVSGKNQFY
jgi:hypothetical protein